MTDLCIHGTKPAKTVLTSTFLRSMLQQVWLQEVARSVKQYWLPPISVTAGAKLKDAGARAHWKKGK